MSEPPIDEQFAGTVEPPKRWAAGLPAVAVSLRKGVAAMGVKRIDRHAAPPESTRWFRLPGLCLARTGHAHIGPSSARTASRPSPRRRRRRGSDRHSSPSIRSPNCAERSEHWLGQQGRLTVPMVKRSGGTHYEPIAWTDAFDMIARELAALPSPDAAAFYTSGRTSNEAAFLYQLLARSFGTNNLPDCSNMCHEASGAALTETIGIGKGSVHITDFAEADLIVVVGQNPGTNHPRMLSTLEEAKRQRRVDRGDQPAARGRPDPVQEPAAGQRRCSAPAPHSPTTTSRSGSTATSRSSKRSITCSLTRHRQARGHERVGIDRTFIDELTSGFDAFEAAARDVRLGRRSTAATGFDRSVAEAFAERVRRSERIIVCWAMGLTQHANSVATIREVVNFLLLGGNIGRPGAGVCPVRGHSNVQGDRTMGIVERPSDEFLDALAERVLVRAAACARPRHRRHDPGDARRRRSRSSWAWAATSRRPRPTRLRRTGAGTLRPHRAGVDEAQRVAPRRGRPGVDPADEGTHRAPRGRRRGAGRDGRGLDGRRACVARFAPAGVRRPVERGRDRLPDRRGAARPSPAARRCRPTPTGAPSA